IQDVLRGQEWRIHMNNMFGNEPRVWDDALDGADRQRFIVNALTRMRMCEENGALNFSFKGPPEKRDGLQPWFDLPVRAIVNDTAVLGHWAALGLYQAPHAIGLDTGCVWGRTLTAIRLQERKMVQVSCADMQHPRNSKDD